MPYTSGKRSSRRKNFFPNNRHHHSNDDDRNRQQQDESIQQERNTLCPDRLHNLYLEHNVASSIRSFENLGSGPSLALLGNSGDGKSTVCNYLMGKELKKVKSGLTYTYVPADPHDPSVAPVGEEKMTSKTVVPTVYAADLSLSSHRGGERSLVVTCIDNPGTKESRGLNFELLTSYCRALCLRSLPNDIDCVVYVVDINRLFSGKTEIFDEIFSNLSAFYGTPNFQKAFNPRISFAFTKASEIERQNEEETDDRLLVYLSELKGQLARDRESPRELKERREIVIDIMMDYFYIIDLDKPEWANKLLKIYVGERALRERGEVLGDEEGGEEEEEEEDTRNKTPVAEISQDLPSDLLLASKSLLLEVDMKVEKRTRQTSKWLEEVVERVRAEEKKRKELEEAKKEMKQAENQEVHVSTLIMIRRKQRDIEEEKEKLKEVKEKRDREERDIRKLKEERVLISSHDLVDVAIVRCKASNINTLWHFYCEYRFKTSLSMVYAAYTVVKEDNVSVMNDKTNLNQKQVDITFARSNLFADEPEIEVCLQLMKKDTPEVRSRLMGIASQIDEKKEEMERISKEVEERENKKREIENKLIELVVNAEQKQITRERMKSSYESLLKEGEREVERMNGQIKKAREELFGEEKQEGEKPTGALYTAITEAVKLVDICQLFLVAPQLSETMTRIKLAIETLLVAIEKVKAAPKEVPHCMRHHVTFDWEREGMNEKVMKLKEHVKKI